MPQIGGPAPTIIRGPINAAYPPAAPAQPPNTLRFASFNVENYFPVDKVNDGHKITLDEYNERTDAIVQAIRNFLKEPDVDRRAGGRRVRRRRQRADRPRPGARRLHAATSRSTTTAAGSRPAS